MKRFADKSDGLSNRFQGNENEEEDQKDESKNQKEKEDENKPNVEHKTHTVEHDIIEATIHYKNGDVETVETYGEYERDEEHIDIIINKEPDCSVGSWTKYNPISDSIDVRTLHPTYLSRDIEYEKVGTEIWEIDTKKKQYRDSRGFEETKYKIENFSSYRPVDKYK